MKRIFTVSIVLAFLIGLIFIVSFFGKTSDGIDVLDKIPDVKCFRDLNVELYGNRDNATGDVCYYNEDFGRDGCESGFDCNDTSVCMLVMAGGSSDEIIEYGKSGTYLGDNVYGVCESVSAYGGGVYIMVDEGKAYLSRLEIDSY